MRKQDIRNYWNQNAPAWTELSRRGYDLYRDHIATPAFLNMLPSVAGLVGLDVGCGEGHNTRLIAEKGAVVTGIDISEKFISYAKERESGCKNLMFIAADAYHIPFNAGYFDFCISTQAFMDFPDQHKALREIYRVLKPEGFFQFSILHPLFDRVGNGWIYENGELKGYFIKNYFKNPRGEIDEWMFSAVPPEEKAKYKKFKIPRFNKLISEWVNLLVKTGFIIEEMDEPAPKKDVIKRYPKLKDAALMPYFLIIRVRK